MNTRTKALIIGCCSILLVFILLNIISSDFQIKSSIFLYRLEDLSLELFSQNKVCQRFDTSNGSSQNLINIQNISKKNDKYNSLEDSVLNYYWETQYLPVADIYCTLPWGIKSVSISSKINLDSNVYSVRVKIIDYLNQVYEPLVQVEYSTNTNTYSVINIQKYLI